MAQLSSKYDRLADARNGQNGHDRDMSTLSPTPLVVEIARHLKTDGRFVMRVEPNGWHHGQLQAVVEVGWAACQAGRVLNRAVHLTTTREADGPGTYTVTAKLAARGPAL